tara:strand:+ start:377 stop:1015 length:639 start_codon:yes stop_codon:yes gene_type:complete
MDFWGMLFTVAPIFLSSLGLLALFYDVKVDHWHRLKLTKFGYFFTVGLTISIIMSGLGALQTLRDKDNEKLISKKTYLEQKEREDKLQKKISDLNKQNRRLNENIKIISDKSNDIFNKLIDANNKYQNLYDNYKNVSSQNETLIMQNAELRSLGKESVNQQIRLRREQSERHQDDIRRARDREYKEKQHRIDCARWREWEMDVLADSEGCYP